MAWSFIDCASNQPGDSQGDGDTEADCKVSDDGTGFCVRAERDGSDPAGRTYAVTIRGVDACGNAATAVIGAIHVPRDASGHASCR